MVCWRSIWRKSTIGMRLQSVKGRWTISSRNLGSRIKRFVPDCCWLMLADKRSSTTRLRAWRCLASKGCQVAPWTSCFPRWNLEWILVLGRGHMDGDPKAALFPIPYTFRTVPTSAFFLPWRWTAISYAMSIPVVLVQIRSTLLSKIKLFPALRNVDPDRDWIIVMDNASIHRSDVCLICLWLLKAFVADNGVRLQFLPPYSPDYNLIEYSFSVLKKHFKNNDYLSNITDGDEIEFANAIIAAAGDAATLEISRNQYRHCGFRVQ